jgi:hypothetical protein
MNYSMGVRKRQAKAAKAGGVPPGAKAAGLPALKGKQP